jgi:hypothetical protein
MPVARIDEALARRVDGPGAGLVVAVVDGDRAGLDGDEPGPGWVCQPLWPPGTKTFETT